MQGLVVELLNLAFFAFLEYDFVKIVVEYGEVADLVYSLLSCDGLDIQLIFVAYVTLFDLI